MPHRPRPTAAPPDVDVDPAVLQRLDADVCAALDFLVDHATDVPWGREVAECLARSGRSRRPPVADLRAG
jgi:hypothetical protein